MFSAAALLCLSVSIAAGDGLYQPTEAKHPIAAIETYELAQPFAADKLQLHITYPSDAAPEAGFPIIVWSHGLGGSKDAYQPLVTYWAEHGYVVIQPTHDDSLAKLTPEEKQQLRNVQDLKKLTTSWHQRPKQIALIIDSLEKIEKDNAALAGRLDAKHIGVGGHSFGAHTTMMAAGFTLHSPIGRRSLQEADPRPLAFVAISPQGPTQAADESSYQPMTRPMLMITGSHDSSPLDPTNDADWRLKAWQYTAPGDKYLLWVDGAYHGFGGISGKIRYSGSGPANDSQVEIVRTTALAMWDAYLKNDAGAKQWLHDAGDLHDGQQQAKVSRK